MAKISRQAKQRYLDKLNAFKSNVEEIQKHETSVQATLGEGDAKSAYRRVALADESLNLVSYYVLMNELSMALLGVKNDAFLNNARKCCYKGIIYLEEVVSTLIDAPFSEYEDRVGLIAKLDERKRYYLLRKLGYSIQSVIDAFGDNSKWKWSFVEIEGRFATVVKNFLNMKTLIAGMDPRADAYEETLAHVALAKRLLQQAADRYRQKYELSTLRIDDFKLAIRYLSGLRRLHIYLGESDESEALKKKIDIWRAKMESDLKKSEKRPNRVTST